MIKFDLEQVKVGRKVQLLTGQPVEILTHKRPGNYPVVGMLPEGEVLCFNVNGYASQGQYQLCMQPQIQTRYFNIYTRQDGSMLVGDCADSLDKSMSWATSAAPNLKFIRREIVEITL